MELKPDGPTGCALHYRFCPEVAGEQGKQVDMTVEQISWESGDSTWPDVQEMLDAVGGIMNNCDTTTTTAKWGGYKSVTVASGMRMYNVTAVDMVDYPYDC